MAPNSNSLRGVLLATTALVAGAGGSAPTAFAQNILPTNGLVTSGSASIRQSGANLTVNQTSSRAIVNWGSFSIGPANGVTFDQPSASSATLNRVTGTTTSTIAGQLQANGQVYLVNPNGIAITKTGAVQVGGGFVASTLGIADSDFNNGNLNFVGKGASAGVSNAGSITASPGGFVGLLGGTVANSGVVSVPLGKVAMGSGEQATLNLTGDNFLQVAMPTNTKTADGQALIDVSGKVRAAGGSVQLRAATVAQAIRNAVNVPGELSVTSARASGGSIILGGGPGGDVSVAGRLKASGRNAGGTIAISGHDVALRQAKLAASSAKGRGGSVTVTGTNAVSLASSLVYASGATGGGAVRIGGDFHGASDVTSAQTTTIDSASTLNASATVSGDGGTVAVWSDATTNFAGKITATGGPNGGDGGSVEVSANPATHGVLTYSGLADLTASKGTTGTLLLDPFDITISTGTDSCPGCLSPTGTYAPTATSVINNVTLENQLVTSNVIVSTGLAGTGGDAGNLTVSAPITWATGNSLALTAFNNIVIGAPISATGGGGLTLNGGASVNINSPLSTTTGSIAVTSGSVVANSPTVLDANLTTSAGLITFNDAVQLAGNVTLNTTLGAGTGFAPVTFNSTIDSAPASPPSDLTVIAGNIFLNGALGGTNPLGAVSLTQTVGTLSVPSITATGDIKLTGGAAVSPISPIELTGNISTSGGGVSFTNAVQIGGIVSVNSGTAGTVTFKSTVDSTPGFSGIACADCELTVSGGGVTFGGNVGSTTPLNLLSVTGATTLAGNVTTTGDITFNSPLQLQNTVTVNSGAGTVAFDSTVDSAPAFPRSGLTVNAGSINFRGPLGGTNPLGAVSLTQTGGSLFLPSITATGDITLTGGAAAGPFSPIELTGNISTSGGGVALNSAVGLQSNVTVSAPTGAVTFASTVDTSFSTSCAVACDLTVSASSINFGGALGGSSALGAVSLTSTNGLTLPSIDAGALTATSTAGGITLGGPLTVAGNVALNAAGDVVQQPGAFIDPTNLTIASAGGSITLNTTVTASASVTLSAADDIIETTGGSVDASTLSASSTTGRVVMTSDNAILTSVSGSAPQGFSFLNGGDLSVGGITSTTGSIFLASGDGSITQTGPIIGSALVAEAAGDVRLNTGANSVGTVAGNSGLEFDFKNVAPTLIVGPVSYFTSTATTTPLLVTSPAAVSGRDCDANCPANVVVSNVGNLALAASATVNNGPDLPPRLIPSGNVVLSATGSFTNNSGLGPAAVSTPNGNWQIYAASPIGDVFDGLDSGQTAVWHTTFSGTVTPTSVNRYYFAFQPTVTITSGDLTESYGQDVTSPVAADFTITGLEPGVPGAFLSDAASAVYSGTPTVTSLGSPARASVAGSPYPITVAQGSFAVSDNYALFLDSAGRLTIDPLPLTYAVADANSTYGTTPILGAARLSGFLPGDTVSATVGAFSGATQVAVGPRTPVGLYSQEVTALSSPDYFIAPSGNTPGTLTIDPLAITYSVADASSIFGMTPILGPATLFGVLPGDIVTPTVGVFFGAVPIALSPFIPVGRYAQLVTAISNPDYRIAPAPNFPGVLTISAPTANPGAPSDPGFLPGLTQINNPAQTEYDVGGYEQVLPRFTVNCNEPPSLPDPNRYSDPDQALRAISQSLENYFKHCQNPTQTTIANALDEYAAKLQVLAPRLPAALRNVPAIVAESARRVRAARSRSEAVAVLRQTVAAVHKEIALVLSEDPETRSREVRDGDVIAGALGGANVALVNSGGL